MGYKIVRGKINHARGGLGDVRLEIDVSGSSLKRVFKGDTELHELNGKKVKIYIPKIDNKEKENKKEKIAEMLKLKKLNKK